MEYLRNNGCQYDSRACFVEAGKKDNFKCLQYIYDSGLTNVFICDAVAKGGSLFGLKFLQRIWSKNTPDCAATGGHFDCLKYLIENGCEYEEDNVIYSAACGGNVECIKYLREMGCVWHEDMCAVAAKYGHLDCLKYLRENGCKWNEKTCTLAAQNGKLDCLKYAYENNCPFSSIRDLFISDK